MLKLFQCLNENVSMEEKEVDHGKEKKIVAQRNL
jgi:hypothetical protein